MALPKVPISGVRVLRKIFIHLDEQRMINIWHEEYVFQV
jgi:hypothetical protein